MTKVAIVIGGERSSGKTTLFNYLLGGAISGPFPRGVHGRLSSLNTARFIPPRARIASSSRLADIVRVSTYGSNRKELEVRSISGDSASILMLTVSNLTCHLLRAQSEDESVGLSLTIYEGTKRVIRSIAEVNPSALRCFVDTGNIIEPRLGTRINPPDLYIHLTSAIKPLAYVERQAIHRFASQGTPVLLFVNKCDQVDDAESLDEVSALVSGFSNIDSHYTIPNYLCSFSGELSPASEILSAQMVVDVIHLALSDQRLRNPSQGYNFGDINSSVSSGQCMQVPASSAQEPSSELVDTINVWPPVNHQKIIDRLNRIGCSPQALIEELRSMDLTTLSTLKLLYWNQLSPEVRRFLLILRKPKG